MIRAAACAVLLALAAVAPARAEADLFSRETLSGLVDLRLAAAKGEKSFTAGSYGKGRYSGADDGYRITSQVAEAALVWKPRFTWNLSGVVQLDAQPGQEHVVDVTEAYLLYRPTPRSDWRYNARAGYFYPPISQEHTDPAWGVTHTITPSAINSWVGEEVKVLGFEHKITHAIGDQEISATVAAFGYNDTSGTLLALRGWALHDIKATAFGETTLPKLQPQYVGIWRGQAPYTVPTINLTGRIGYYGRLDWQTAWPVAFNLFYYDNGGDRISVYDGQWSWQTRFWNAGASWDVDRKTLILAQALTGRTKEGYPTPQGVWIDATFSSAYVLATHSFGKTSLTGRIDWFDTVDHTFVQRDNNNEWGWAYTAAVRYEISSRVTLLIEAMHVDSDRYAREYVGLEDRQKQNTIQTSLRLRL